MAYDLHISRIRFWSDASHDPIAKQEVDELVDADPELSWSESDFVDMRGRVDRVVQRYFMIIWQGTPCFWWYLDQIYCSSPSDAQILKMIHMARQLNAMVVGDDGELYQQSGNNKFIVVAA